MPRSYRLVNAMSLSGIGGLVVFDPGDGPGRDGFTWSMLEGDGAHVSTGPASIEGGLLVLSHAGTVRHGYDEPAEAEFRRLVGMEPWARTPYWRWDDDEARRCVGSGKRVEG